MTFPAIDAPMPLVVALAAALGLFAVLVVVRRRGTAAVGSTADLDADAPVAPHPTPVDEAQVPRWRRPSVVAARFETDTTIVVRAQTPGPIDARRAPTVFPASTDGEGERMRIRYDGVPLLDQPDDALGRSRADLDKGDEVAVLERDEIWMKVGTPAGATGWVPAMVLVDGSDWVDEDPEPAYQTESTTPHDDQPSLEVLLAAVAAERRAREESLLSMRPARQPEVAARNGKPAPKPAAKAAARPRRASGPATRPT